MCFQMLKTSRWSPRPCQTQNRDVFSAVEPCPIEGLPLPVVMSLSSCPTRSGHPSLAEFIDELLRLRIFLVIHPHHLLDRISNHRTCLRMTFDPLDTPSILLFIFFCFAFAILFTGISPSLLTAESFLFNDARKSSNCPMCKCFFVLICKCVNVFLCVCVYVLMHLC